jgi:hypothetical protein
MYIPSSSVAFFPFFALVFVFFVGAAVMSASSRTLRFAIMLLSSCVVSTAELRVCRDSCAFCVWVGEMLTRNLCARTIEM